MDNLHDRGLKQYKQDLKNMGRSDNQIKKDIKMLESVGVTPKEINNFIDSKEMEFE